jgi:hypothetical protein
MTGRRENSNRGESSSQAVVQIQEMKRRTLGKHPFKSGFSRCLGTIVPNFRWLWYLNRAAGELYYRRRGSDRSYFGGSRLRAAEPSVISAGRKHLAYKETSSNDQTDRYDFYWRFVHELTIASESQFHISKQPNRGFTHNQTAFDAPEIDVDQN